MGFADILGTSYKFIQFGIGGPFIKAISNAAGFAVRNANDTADVPFKTSQLKNSGKNLILNSDAANSGSDWPCAIAVPSTGQSAAKTITLPARPSVAGYAVVVTDAADTWDYVAFPTLTDRPEDKTYTINFNSASPLSLIALPANAIAKQITVFIDTGWSGYTSAPTLTIGTASNPTLFMSSSQIDLTDAIGAKSYTVNPSVAPNTSIIQLIGTYTANGATAGSGRIVIDFSTPSNP